MAQVLLSLKDIPPEGQEFSFSDPGLWTVPWREFGITYGMGDSPLRATLILVPCLNGCRIRSHLAGTLTMPCDRCTELTTIVLDSRFDEYETIETLPTLSTCRSKKKKYKLNKTIRGQTIKPDLLFATEQKLLRWYGTELKLNVSALLWELFVLAIPIKSLCSPVCKGLCPACGQHQGKNLCGCTGHRDN